VVVAGQDVLDAEQHETHHLRPPCLPSLGYRRRGRIGWDRVRGRCDRGALDGRRLARPPGLLRSLSGERRARPARDGRLPRGGAALERRLPGGLREIEETLRVGGLVRGQVEVRHVDVGSVRLLEQEPVVDPQRIGGPVQPERIDRQPDLPDVVRLHDPLDVGGPRGPVHGDREGPVEVVLDGRDRAGRQRSDGRWLEARDRFPDALDPLQQGRVEVDRRGDAVRADAPPGAAHGQVVREDGPGEREERGDEEEARTVHGGEG